MSEKFERGVHLNPHDRAKEDLNILARIGRAISAYEVCVSRSELLYQQQSVAQREKNDALELLESLLEEQDYLEAFNQVKNFKGVL